MSDRLAPLSSRPIPSSDYQRRVPIGAELIRDGRTHVRVWAPRARNVRVVCRGVATPLMLEANGYHSGEIAAAAGDRYQFKLDADEKLYPDPASRFQPEGPHGPSEIVDSRAFRWSDQSWAGASIRGQVAYELHFGTFTREGTYAAAAKELCELARAGITLIELMPVSEFDGRFGWGYDGVDLFAPSHLYGGPDDLRGFVDTARGRRAAVILDVVYNHLGPVGNYLRAFAPAYFTDRYDNEWGDAINFDGPDGAPVREFFLANRGYWIDEFHLDGFRLDATQQIFDRSPRCIVEEFATAVRDKAPGRATIIVAEN